MLGPDLLLDFSYSSLNLCLRYSNALVGLLAFYIFIALEGWLRPGFEPGSATRKATMLDRIVH